MRINRGKERRDAKERGGERETEIYRVKEREIASLCDSETTLPAV